MNVCYFPVHTRGNELRFAFCAKRLAKLILKKAIKGDWFCLYFKLHQTFFEEIPGYRADIISDKGLILFIKE